MRCAILAFLAGVCWLHTRAELPPPACLAGALAAALVLFLLRKRAATLLAAAILGAAWSAWLAHVALADALPREQEGRDVTIVGTVDSLPHEFDGGARFHLRVERVLTPDATVPPRIAISWYGQPADTDGLTPVEPGERWQLVVRLQRPHGNANPYGLLRQRNCYMST
ncbi:ComEC/Rec2 family competence protein [Massilia sp. UBA6681]|uniref:ComEC/Rec2 family competence protein n=1 Tax=Massilia sp. UBA6681 TaxID=1946839 RepID=UPI0025BD57E3|nr:ComEC/Rec2 family competence protein [Massilia sp. UBA6681]